jgi:anti-sigma B factor antagonist
MASRAPALHTFWLTQDPAILDSALWISLSRLRREERLHMTEKQSHITVRDSGSVRTVHFSVQKILDELTIADIGNELSQLVKGNTGIKILLSFQDVEHLSSAALSMLISLSRQIDEVGGDLKMADIAPPIYEVFKITRLNRLFKIHGTTQEALAEF